MDHPPLIHSMNAAGALAAFDPVNLGLTFACARSAATMESAVELAAVTSAEDISSVMETLDRDVPVETLTHEMIHLYQATATSSGIRNFIEMHRYLVRCCWAIATMAAGGGGEVPIGFLSNRDGRALPVDLGELVASLDAARYALLVLKGGVLFPLVELAPYRMSGATANLFRVKGVFPGDDVVWCLDLTDLGGPAGTAVTLGTLHLFEGQALMAELFRGTLEAERAGRDRADLIASLNKAPVNPYQVVRSVYLSYCRNRPAGAISPDVELLFVTDAALMADDWATIDLETVANGHDWKNGNAFDRFVTMCRALHDHPEWRLTSLETDRIVAFQETLLGAAGSRVADVAVLTAAAQEKYPFLLAELQRESPLFSLTVGSWREAFATMLDDRARHRGGGGTAVTLANMPRDRLAEAAVGLMTTTYRQPISFTDDVLPEPELLSLACLPHVKAVLEEILYGGRPCEVRAQCGLPGRAACSGVPDLNRLEPQGRRCMRECAVMRVVEQLGISKLVG